MTSDEDALRAAAERVIELEEEVEAGGVAALDEAALSGSREVLRSWVEGITGVVVSPGLGRVTLFHREGLQSTIASSTLAYALSKRVGPRSDA